MGLLMSNLIGLHPNYSLEQYLLRAESGSFSGGAAESAQTFQDLNRALPFLANAPLRYQREVVLVIQTIQHMVQTGRYFDPDLALQVERALELMEKSKLANTPVN
jgi:hypothetical protein